MKTLFNILIGIFMVDIAVGSPTRITVPSHDTFKPFKKEEVERLIGQQFPIEIIVDENMARNDETLQNREITQLQTLENLLSKEVYNGKHLKVFYPKTPRVPHQLVIEFIKERKNFHITKEENAELSSIIDRIDEIYKKKFKINDFVISRTMREGHYVVQIKPTLPNFSNSKHIIDKVESYAEDIFPGRCTPVPYQISESDVSIQANKWEKAFKKSYPPIKYEKTVERHQCYHDEAMTVLFNRTLEWFESKGAKIENRPPFEAITAMPTAVPKSDTIEIKDCCFCNKDIIDKQLVYQRGGVAVLLNSRKSAEAGTDFLIIPYPRHIERNYELTDSESNTMCFMMQALEDVLKEKFTGYEVAAYTQDGHAVGQTVFHTHIQFKVFDPETVAFSTTVMSMAPGENFSVKDMEDICAELAPKLKQRFDEILSETNQFLEIGTERVRTKLDLHSEKRILEPLAA